MVSVVQLSSTVAPSPALSVVDVELDDESEMTLNTRVTDVWQLIDGRWSAVHEHASVPIDLERGTAILDAPVR